MAFPPTDWGDFTTDEYQVGAPGTSYSFERWFRNPVAMAQGAVGAPRVMTTALGGQFHIGSASSVGNNPVAFINTGGIRSFYGICAANRSTSGPVEFSLSTDNGSTWGAYITLKNVVANGEVVFFSICTGTGSAMSIKLDAVTPSDLNQSFTPVVNANAIRFRNSAAGIGMNVALMKGGVNG